MSAREHYIEFCRRENLKTYILLYYTYFLLPHWQFRRAATVIFSSRMRLASQVVVPLHWTFTITSFQAKKRVLQTSRTYRTEKLFGKRLGIQDLLSFNTAITNLILCSALHVIYCLIT